MPTIYRYRKAYTDYSTITLRTPDEDSGVQELCTLDGITYVCVPDGVTLPQQPEQITVEPVEPDDELRAAIGRASPQCQEIERQQRAQIRAEYDLEDELKLARIGTGVALQRYQLEPGEADELEVYQSFVEDVRQWGRIERAKLGLCGA